MIRFPTAIGLSAVLALGTGVGLLQETPRAPVSPADAKAAPHEWDLAPPQPIDEELPRELLRWREHACVECHEAQAQEWAKSLHALAWIDPRYREELADKKRPESCHGCHIPLPVHEQDLAQKPAPRYPSPAKDASTELAARDAHFGVDCYACHESKAGMMLGPYGIPTEAHLSEKSASFLPEGQSRLCITCHATSIGPVIGVAKDFADTRQWEKGKSCVGCHMQRVERPMAKQAGKPEFPVRPGRSHELQTPRDPAFLARAFDITLEASAGGVVVAIVNTCGHRVPGLVERRIEISAEIVGAGEGARGSIEITNKSFLRVDGRLEIALQGRGERVRVVGRHEALGMPEPIVFLDREIAVPR